MTVPPMRTGDSIQREVASVVDEADRSRFVDLLVVMEFCRHPGIAAQADRVEDYARALGVDEPFLLVARDALTAGHAEVMADWILDIAAKVGALDRPGAAAELADAFRRGAACTCDFSAIDHLARVDDPLDAVRADCGITPRSA